LRAWVRNGGVAVVDTAGVAERDARPAIAIWRAPDGRVLAHARSLGRGRLIELAGPFAPASLPELLEPTFPQQLDALLRGGARAPRRAVATAIAPLRSDVDVATPTTPLDGVFALAIAALCAVERLVALRQRREWRP
jgi:hypothetical protein